MPVILVGAAYMATGATAFSFAAGWTIANVAAAAAFIGGAMTIIGETTNNEKLKKNGMILGAVGSLGVAMTGPAPGSIAADKAAESAATEAAKNTATTSTGQTGLVQGSSVDGLSATATPAGQGMTMPATSNATGLSGGTNIAGAANTDMAAMFARSDAAMQKIASQNLIAQTVGGVAQGYSNYEQAKSLKETEQAKLDELKRLNEREYSNRNTLSGAVIQKASIPTAGLINAKPLSLT